MSEDIQFRYPAMTTLSELDTAIAGAIDAAKTMKKKVQYAAIGCMILAGRAGKDEDSGKDYAELACDKANYLVEQVGAGVKGEGLVKFLVYMCGFKVNEAAKKEGFVDVAGESWIRAHLEDAKAKAWFDYAPATPFKGFNLMEELNRVMKQADQAVKLADGDEAKAELIEVDRDMLEIVHSLLGGTPVKHEHALRLVDRLIPVKEEAAA